MIIDFHIHYSPEELVAENSVRGDSPDRFCRGVLRYSFTAGFLTGETHCLWTGRRRHRLPFLGIRVGEVTGAVRMVNDKLEVVEGRFPGRFLEGRCSAAGGRHRSGVESRPRLGFKGVAILPCSEPWNWMARACPSTAKGEELGFSSSSIPIELFGKLSGLTTWAGAW